MTVTFYAIMHKESLELMPFMRRGRGYSYWNPDNPKMHGIARRLSLSIPRLLESKKKAQRCIAAWNCMPNSRNDQDGDLDIRPDNRKKEDLEVIEVELQFKV